MMNKREIGSGYEEMAAAYLVQHGYTILERNFRDRSGEIDIIASEGGDLVFVEVKYRRGGTCGDPAEAVTPQKQKRIRHTARYYLYKKGGGGDVFCRFDVVAILGKEIRLIRDAF